jgi:hypothetical protein
MRPSRRRQIRPNGLVAALWVVAVLLLMLVVVGAARSDGKPPQTQRCTHGLSSIGPVTIVDGKIVGGLPTPDTEACLP